MVTDKERHDVARKLRELHPEDKAWWGIYGFDWYMFADSLFDAIGCNDSRNWTDYLADLIEPDHIGDSNKMVDRNALRNVANQLLDDTAGLNHRDRAPYTAREIWVFAARILDAIGGY